MPDNSLAVIAADTKSPQSPNDQSPGFEPVARHRRATWGWLLILLLCAAGLSAQLWVTRFGLGLSPDSVTYLRIAQSLQSGSGFGFSDDTGKFNTLVHWPPLFPASMVAASRVLGELRHATYILQAVLLPTNLLLMALLTRRLAGGSWPAAVAGAMVAGLSVEMFSIHAMLISEPLFLSLLLGGVLVLDRALREADLRLLIVAGVLLGLSWLTRYAAAGVVGAAAFCVLTFWRTPIARRTWAAILFCVVSAVPMALWLVWGWIKANSLANRQFAWHAFDAVAVENGYRTIARWLLPYDLASDNAALAIAIVQGIVILVSIAWILLSGTTTWKSRRATVLVSLVATGYAIFLLLSLCFIDAYTPLDRRTLLPVQVLTIPLVCGAFVPLIGRRQAPGWTRVGIAITCLGLIVCRIGPIKDWMTTATYNRLGYNSEIWHRSPIMKAVRRLPKAVRIFSNRSDAIFACTGRVSLPLPQRKSLTRQENDPLFHHRLTRLRKTAGLHPVYIVLIRRPGLEHIADADDLQRYFRLTHTASYRDGTILHAHALPTD